MFGRTLSFCVAKRERSRHDKESLAMDGRFCVRKEKAADRSFLPAF